jgi:hypothetical protein
MILENGRLRLVGMAGILREGPGSPGVFRLAIYEPGDRLVGVLA